MGTAGSDWGTFCITWEHLRAKHENFVFQGTSPIQVLIVVIGQHFGHIDLNIMLFGKHLHCFVAWITCRDLHSLGNIFGLWFWIGERPCTFFNSATE